MQRPLTGPSIRIHLPGYSTFYTDGVALSECDHNPTNAKPCRENRNMTYTSCSIIRFPMDAYVRLSRGQGEPMPILERTRLASFGASLR